LAVYISVVSLIINFGYNVYKEKQFLKEELLMHYIPVTKLYETKVSLSHYQEAPAIISQLYPCVITNNGARTMAIIDYKLDVSESVLEKAMGAQVVQYSQLNQGIYNKEQKEMDLPIIIPPGESISVYVKVGALITPEASELIKQKYGLNTLVNNAEVSQYLAMNNTDYYGNEVKPNIIDGKILGYSAKQDKTPVYRITLKSSKNNYFSINLSEKEVEPF
jgi:hypothetical protein